MAPDEQGTRQAAEDADQRVDEQLLRVVRKIHLVVRLEHGRDRFWPHTQKKIKCNRIPSSEKSQCAAWNSFHHSHFYFNSLN